MALTFMTLLCKSILTNFALVTMKSFVKHEVVCCDRCGQSIECRANAYAKCQCSTVRLSVVEVEYISECYENCLCAACLKAMQRQYESLRNSGIVRPSST